MQYKGKLRKDEYQFTFGGKRKSGLDTGFLVPQSGRIKKIKGKILCRGKDASGHIFQ